MINSVLMSVSKNENNDKVDYIKLGLWCLTPLSTIFQLQVYHGVRCTGGGNRSTQRKPLTCCKSGDNLYHIMLYRVHLAMSGIQTHNFSGDRH
jgi:hypothetical protein